MTTPRQLMYQTLDFASPARVPRQLWTLPWAEMYHPGAVKRLRRDFPDDMTSPQHELKTSPRTQGEQYEIGVFVDAWGCTFTNYQRGVIGEVKQALIAGDDWEDRANLHLPVELLSVDKNAVNAFCRSSDRFVMGASVNPFERLQWIRGTEQLYVDIALRSPGMFDVLQKVHAFNCEHLSVWAGTEVDAISIFDDWGAQHSLLINPSLWVDVFKPMYKYYVAIAHSHGKRIFMHSDGYTLDIIPHMIDLGIDAANLQLFCIGLDKLEQFRGKLTFCGEIDRQHLLPYATPAQIEQAVVSVKDALWANGGCIAQCEFVAGANPENVYKVFETWQRIGG